MTTRPPTGSARRTVVLVSVLAAALLAGCAQGRETQPVPDAEVAAVRGVVLDAAIRPLEGVTVSIPAHGDLSAQVTGPDGAFTFDGLTPGTLFLEARKDGYLSAVVQATAVPGESPLVQITLTPLEETRPYYVLESFRGFLECGVGSAPAFGLTAGCMVVAGGALYIVCTGSEPVPPTGICLGGTSPYFLSVARGNMSTAQTEAVWEPTVPGMSELLLGGYVVDPEGAIVGGVPDASGPSVLVRRLNETVVQENDLGGAHSLALFVNPGNTGPVNVVVRQPYEVFHTSTFFFTPEEGWVFAVDGPPVVPDRLLR